MSEDHDPLPRGQDLLPVPVIAAVLITAILFWRDVPTWRCVVIGLTTGTTGFFLMRAAGVSRPRWPSTQPGSARYARRNLDWLLVGVEADLREPDRFRTVLRPRLAALTAGVLDRSSVPLDSARARDALGARHHQLLTDPDCPPPHRRELLALISAITALAADDPDHPLTDRNGSPTG